MKQVTLKIQFDAEKFRALKYFADKKGVDIDISSDLAGIEAHINHKGALTRQETEDVHASLLRIAGNCFRQCVTIMRVRHEAEMHGLTISQ